MRSVPEFFFIALLVTLTPGPATALILRVAARDGRRAALGAVVGNSIGVLMWGCLSALGVASLILASQIAFDVLRIGGAAVVIVAFDVLWFSILAYAVDRAGTLLRPRVRHAMERVTGGVMLAFGLSIAAEAR